MTVVARLIAGLLESAMAAVEAGAAVDVVARSALRLIRGAVTTDGPALPS